MVTNPRFQPETSPEATPRHPLAGKGMTGAEMVVQVLADEGVDTIFGYSGGAILPTYDAVFRYNEEHGHSMPLIVPANEQGAGDRKSVVEGKGVERGRERR